MSLPARRLWFAALALAAAGATGCAGQLDDPPGSGGAAGLRAGVGWSAAKSPAAAGRQAMLAALAPLGGADPEMVLVWENQPTAEDARQVLAAVCRHASPRVVYGGHVAWPVATRWTTEPTVTVLVMGGGWTVRAAVAHDVSGREQEAGWRLAEELGLAARAGLEGHASSWPAVPEGHVSSRPRTRRSGSLQPGDVAPPGELVLVFGQASGSGGRRLLRGVTLRAGERATLLGGSGSGQAGSGWQFVAGRQTTDAVWAVRLTGPFAARAVWLAGEPDPARITQTASLATSLLAEPLLAPGLPPAERRPTDAGPEPAGHTAPPWRLALIVQSAGWLAFLRQPEQIAVDAADRLAPPARPPTVSNGNDAAPLEGPAASALVAGWAGDWQIGPDPHHGTLEEGPFAIAMALVEPRAAPHTPAAMAASPAPPADAPPPAGDRPTGAPPAPDAPSEGLPAEDTPPGATRAADPPPHDARRIPDAPPPPVRAWPRLPSAPQPTTRPEGG